jgi:hypothetical protein
MGFYQWIVMFKLLRPIFVFPFLVFSTHPTLLNFIGCMVLIVLLYYLREIIFFVLRYRQSFREWQDFKDAFVTEKRLFQLNSVSHLVKVDLNLFRTVIFANSVLKDNYHADEIKGMFSGNLRFFTVTPIHKDDLLSANKAYSIYLGVVQKHFVVLRSINFERPFQKFLFQHELSHINDVGHSLYLFRITEKSTVLISSGLAIASTNGWQAVIFSFIYLYLSISYIRVLKSREEVYADIFGLATLKDDEERVRVIDMLLTHHHSSMADMTYLNPNWLIFSKRITNLEIAKKTMTDGFISVRGVKTLDYEYFNDILMWFSQSVKGRTLIFALLEFALMYNIYLNYKLSMGLTVIITMFLFILSLIAYHVHIGRAIACLKGIDDLMADFTSPMKS